jgi:hypothetical protein
LSLGSYASAYFAFFFEFQNHNYQQSQSQRQLNQQKKPFKQFLNCMSCH